MATDRRARDRLRWLVSPSVAFLERNHDLRATIFIASSPRSGSTWLAELLAGALRARLVFEPLRQAHPGDAEGIARGTYLPPDEDDASLQSLVGRALSGRTRSRWSDRYNRHRLPARRVVKEIRATALLPWISGHFSDMPVVYLLRHPVPTAWSAAVLGWKAPVDAMCNQRRLLEGPFAAFRTAVDEARDSDDPMVGHLLCWCVENTVALELLRQGTAHVVFYEDLIADTPRELERLGAYLVGRPRRWPLAIPTAGELERPSPMSYRRRSTTDVEDRARSWQRRVPAESLHRAEALLTAFGLDRLYDAEGMPKVPAAEVLAGA